MAQYCSILLSDARARRWSLNRHYTYSHLWVIVLSNLHLNIEFRGALFGSKFCQILNSGEKCSKIPNGGGSESCMMCVSVYRSEIQRVSV